MAILHCRQPRYGAAGSYGKAVWQAQIGGTAGTDRTSSVSHRIYSRRVGAAVPAPSFPFLFSANTRKISSLTPDVLQYVNPANTDQWLQGRPQIGKA